MEHSAPTPSFVGIDVSKDRLDVHLRPSAETFAVARDGEGLEALVAALRRLDVALVVLEATGGFELTVAAALAGAGLPLAVVNPRQIRAFARATGRLAKTDALDAEVIALFAERIRPEPRPVAGEQAQALSELVARRRQLVEMIGQERNRSRQARSRRVQKSLAATLKVLEAQLAALDRDIDGAVRGSPAWREADDLLTSVPGVGDVTSRTLIADLPELGQSAGGASPPRSAWHPSTATPASGAARGPFPGDAPTCATPSTWPPSRPSAATRSSAPTTSASSTGAARRRSRSSPASATSSPSSTPSCAPRNHGKSLDPRHSRSGRPGNRPASGSKGDPARPSAQRPAHAGDGAKAPRAPYASPGPGGSAAPFTGTRAGRRVNAAQRRSNAAGRIQRFQ